MGLMQGKFQGDSIIIMDAFTLPVEGIETRVNAEADAYEYMVKYSTINKQFQEPFLAVVIDPTRTVFAGKVDIGAFRTYPKDYKPSDEPVSEHQTIPLNKIEDFGVHFKQYFSLDITYFKSSLDSHLLDLLWNKYWFNTLSSSPLLGNRDYVAGQIFDLVPTHLVLSDVDQFDTILDMEKDELAPEIEEEEEGEIEYVEGDDIEIGDMDDMEDFEGFGDEDDNVKKLYIF
ncbi:COP9 signalosome complex subunit 5b [Hordeum vulgare]|nr:COP9 signalosome complex subunit 5b [Hordeum vulgare]